MKINFFTSPIRQRVGLLSTLHENDAVSVSLFSYKYLTTFNSFFHNFQSLSLSLFWTVKTTMSLSEKVVEKMITLVSSDGETFEVEEKVAMESQTLKDAWSKPTVQTVQSHCPTSQAKPKKHVEAASESEVDTSYSLSYLVDVTPTFRRPTF